MPFANPPVVEVAIEFQFEAGPDKKPWDLPVAVPFMKRFEEAFPNGEIVASDQFRIEKRSPEGIPREIQTRRILERLRGHNDERSRWLQVGNDLLVYNLVRHQAGAYPGFEQVRDEALDKLDQYVEHFRPICVRQIGLTYIDVIEIPRTTEPKLRLDDYFKLGIEVPDEPFGPVAQFLVGLVLPRTKEADQLALTLQTEPVAPDSAAYRFVMQWQATCEDVKTLDRQEIIRRLEAANTRMVACFKDCFTAEGLKLFGPKAGD